jgi:hypothetical protein
MKLKNNGHNGFRKIYLDLKIEQPVAIEFKQLSVATKMNYTDLLQKLAKKYKEDNPQVQFDLDSLFKW